MRVWHSQRSMSSLSPTTFKSLLSSFELNNLLQLCSNSKNLNQGKQAHQHIIAHGLAHHPFMTTKLVQVYSDCNDITSAHLLFDTLSQPNVFAWTAVLAFYSRNGMSSECVSTYCRMKMNGVLADGYVFPKVIRACALLFCLETGIQIHKEVITSGVDSNVVICNSLIDMYSKCWDVGSARRIFDFMVERDLLSWNSMISGCVYNGFLASAVELLGFMSFDGFEPDTVTGNTVMDAYCRMGRCDEAWEIFGQIKAPNVISWTTLISGYSRVGKHEVTLRIFRDMTHRGRVFADADCLSNVLVSCRQVRGLRCGQEIHAYGIKIVTRCAFYKSAGPVLLTMYAECRRIDDAINVFKLMNKSDVVTWNAMILGFREVGMGQSALDCCRNMQKVGVPINQTTITTVLPACDLKSGKQIHAYLRKGDFSSVVPVWNSLVHMYAKCGCIRTAYAIFLEMENKDVVSWNTMIGGFGMHGFGQTALQLLQEMNISGICPNSLTFTSALSGCSHSGLIDEGLELFHRMTKDFGFNPGMEHFACVVDLLARAGRLEDAVGFIKTMPMEPDKRIWGALLASSQARQDVETGVLASENLVYLEPESAGNYVTLSNMYAKAGRWDDALRVREEMESRRLVKPSGYSWIENVLSEGNAD